MRFPQFLGITINDVAKKQPSYNKMRAFSTDKFKDGWEIWLQCEAFSFLPDSKQVSYSRGDAYPGGQKCDFLLQRAQMKLWLELKVLLKNDHVHLIERFADDINKIRGVKLPKEENSVGAMAVVPIKGSVLFSEHVKRRFQQKTDVDPRKVHFVAAEPGVEDIKGTYNSHHEIDDDRIVILYYVEIE